MNHELNPPAQLLNQHLTHTLNHVIITFIYIRIKTATAFCTLNI